MNGLLSSQHVHFPNLLFKCILKDIKDDILGAMEIGMKAIQVKTGKYMADVKAQQKPTALVENFADAVNWILQNGNL